MAQILLKGISWNHSRGYSPLQAASQRYHELHPEVEIHWHKRSLQDFADFPIEKLTQDFDLLIIDHPWAGCAAATQCVLPMDKYLPEEYLRDQMINTVGKSHFSYNYNNHQWALAIDAATPVASYRKDLFEKNNVKLPSTWQEVIDLARKGKVAVPAIPIDLLMMFYTFCITHGKEPFSNSNEVIETPVGLSAIKTMKELYRLIDKKMFSKNPIGVAELMISSDEYWYCPFAYCYANYSREGYGNKLLNYTDLISFNGNKLITTVGGTGLAVSAFSNHKKIAIDFASMVVSGEYQRTQYIQNGGQPGHLSAWKDEKANSLTNNFFTNVLPAMERGYIRPRYNGYLSFQDQAGKPLHECLLNNGDAKTALNEMNKLYRDSLVKQQSLISL
ncbi:MAG: extracellular solute-binding protein [Chitinophagaceae bacterium]